MNNSEAWLRSITRDAEGVVSRRIGVYQSTLSRQLRADSLTPTSIVAIARSYGASPVAGLIATGLISPDDIARAQGSDALTRASDADLIAELRQRLTDR
ncbi:MAG: hypothetical protein LBV00_04115 [Propionibacteriaceae bacterium]|nr:hypothetical protein [Propionibacteriaceae bacterium]